MEQSCEIPNTQRLSITKTPKGLISSGFIHNGALLFNEPDPEDSNTENDVNHQLGQLQTDQIKPASNLKQPTSFNDGGNSVNNRYADLVGDLDLSMELQNIDGQDVNQASDITNEELRYMVEKLHKFSKWQKAKLAKRAGIVSDFFTKQLDTIMSKSVNVILNCTPKG